MKKAFFNYKNPNPIVFPYRAASKISGLILDFSGTTLDPHVIAPAFSFMEAFAKEGVPITMEEARKPMGLRKDLHILRILEVNLRYNFIIIIEFFFFFYNNKKILYFKMLFFI